MNGRRAYAGADREEAARGRAAAEASDGDSVCRQLQISPRKPSRQVRPRRRLHFRAALLPAAARITITTRSRNHQAILSVSLCHSRMSHMLDQSVNRQPAGLHAGGSRRPPIELRQHVLDAPAIARRTASSVRCRSSQWQTLTRAGNLAAGWRKYSRPLTATSGCRGGRAERESRLFRRRCSGRRSPVGRRCTTSGLFSGGRRSISRVRSWSGPYSSRR
jgi:hypothetical protein